MADMAQKEPCEGCVEYDLTRKITPFLDRHLIFPIFQFLAKTGMYSEVDIDRATIGLLDGTGMIDFLEEKCKEVGDKPPANIEKRRAEVLESLGKSHARVLPLLQILEDDDQMKQIAQMKTKEEVCDAFDLKPDTFEELVRYAKLQYDCGSYAMSGELLKRSVMSSDGENPGGTRQQISCIWGVLASHILHSDFEGAAGAVTDLDEKFDQAKFSKRELLLQRTWLLHWTLFAIFTPTEKPDQRLLDYLFNEKSLVIMSLTSPHLLRYVGACLILQKRLKHLLKDTVRIIKQESESYSDPITRFLLAVYSDMDFDEAQAELQLCRKVCMSDFFLEKHWAEFEENARLLIFETYCRIHQCINIGMLATKLNMGAEEAELWIVKLIQSAKLDARIDSEKSRVVMSKAPPSVYQQVIEKTKNLSFRSTMLLNNLEKREKENEPAVEKKA